MKKLMFVAALTAVWGASAAVAKVSEVRHETRPVHNSGTGVMPAGAQESMPKAARRQARNERYGVGFSPVQFGFFTPLQWPNRDYDVGGFRLDLVYGTCCNFDGLDIGIVGVAQNHANGLLVNLVTCAEGDGIGFTVGGVNYFGGDFIGAQVGLANWIDSGNVVQIGILNRGYDIKGHQLGLINVAEHLEGVQIGLVNVINCSDQKFLPIINMYY